MTNITWPWLTEVGLIAWRSVQKQHRPPLPSELLATFIVFGGASIVSTKSPEVGSLFGWGIVIATLLRFIDPQSSYFGLTKNLENKQQYKGAATAQQTQPFPTPGASRPTPGGRFL